MNQLIDIIFNNPLFLVLIFLGINFLLSQNKSKEEQRPERRQAEPRPVPTPQPVERREVDHNKRNTQVEMSEQLSAEELRRQQLERLTTEIQGNVEEKQDAQESVKKQIQVTKDKKQNKITNKKVRSNLKERLTSKGLIDSVIMAEVLGPPRAVKRYQNRQINHRQ